MTSLVYACMYQREPESMPPGSLLRGGRANGGSFARPYFSQDLLSEPVMFGQRWFARRFWFAVHDWAESSRRFGTQAVPGKWPLFKSASHRIACSTRQLAATTLPLRHRALLNRPVQGRMLLSSKCTEGTLMQWPFAQGVGIVRKGAKTA